MGGFFFDKKFHRTQGKDKPTTAAVVVLSVRLRNGDILSLGLKYKQKTESVRFRRTGKKNVSFRTRLGLLLCLHIHIGERIRSF